MQIKRSVGGVRAGCSLVVVIAMSWSGAAGAADGELCAATSTPRGEFCEAPPGGFATRANCVAAYNLCLTILPRLMHDWCVHVDQPNCDDCPDPAGCYVHPTNQRRWQDVKCHQDAQKRWRFTVFDVADCTCDCSKGAFPRPPGGPETIAEACEDGPVSCFGCTKLSDPEDMCFGQVVPWQQRLGPTVMLTEPPEAPPKTETE